MMGHHFLFNDNRYLFVKYILQILMYVVWIFLFIYYIFSEKIATSIVQTAVPHNNIYFLKKELSGYLNFPNFK